MMFEKFISFHMKRDICTIFVKFMYFHMKRNICTTIETFMYIHMTGSGMIKMRPLLQA